jgi:hypothetical protein
MPVAPRSINTNRFSTESPRMTESNWVPRFTEMRMKFSTLLFQRFRPKYMFSAFCVALLVC